MSFGWSGQILRVDLSKMESSTEDTEPYTHDFIGGRGINVKIIYDEVGPEIAPFDPANRLCFGPGTLGGTLAPSCSRMKVTTMSPNGLITNSGIGGDVAAEIRRAGYDNIVIQGCGDKPVYIYINDDSVEIRDASHIWGKSTWDAQEAIKEELGEEVQIMSIGQGGENLVAFGSIINGKQSSAGRGGMGTIMGSKKLKAIVVKGTKEVKIAKQEEFTAYCEEIEKWLKEHPSAKNLYDSINYYDSQYIGGKVENGHFFLGNYEEDVNWDEEVKKYKNATEFFKQYGVRQYECAGCPIGHSVYFDVPGIGSGACDCSRWVSFVGPIWNSDPKLAFHAAHLCDMYGMDCISTSNSISFMMELYHKGIITEKDTDGIPMKRGDENAIISAIHKIGKQEGFGKLLQNGVKKAAETIGNGAEECAMQVKGMEMYPLEVRTNKSQALESSIGYRDGVEENSWIPEVWITDKEGAIQWAKDLYNFGPEEMKEAVDPTSYDEQKPFMTWDFGNRHCAIDLIGACRNVWTWVVTPSLEIPARLFSLATGRDTSEADLLFAAQRVKTLERAFLVIKGIRRKDDTLPKRLFEMKVPGGMFKGETLDKQKLDKMIDRYYQLRGWDEDGIPTDETFNKFGLSSELKVFKQRMEKQVAFTS